MNIIKIVIATTGTWQCFCFQPLCACSVSSSVFTVSVTLIVVSGAIGYCAMDWLTVFLDISIYQSGYPTQQYQECNNQCLANYTPVLLMILLVKESLAVGRTVQLLEHGHWMVLRWIAVIILDLLDVLDNSLDQWLCILLGPIIMVVIQQYQKETTHVVLMDCVLVLDCGSLILYKACCHLVSRCNNKLTLYMTMYTIIP